MSENSHAETLKWKNFNRQRADTKTLAKNCTVGYQFRETGMRVNKHGEDVPYEHSLRRSNYHHALACEALKDSEIEPGTHIEFFHNCMAITEWNINAGLNLIGLPMKIVFRDADKENAEPIKEPTAAIGIQLGATAEKLAASGKKGGAPNLPCHQHEHAAFNKEVIIRTNKQVWKKLAKNQEPCEVDGKDIKQQLDKECKHWRDWLQSRGKEEHGAAVCWQNRNTPECKPHWYIPLSMNPVTPRKLKPPPNIHEAGNKSEWLSNMLKDVI